MRRRISSHISWSLTRRRSVCRRVSTVSPDRVGLLRDGGERTRLKRIVWARAEPRPRRGVWPRGGALQYTTGADLRVGSSATDSMAAIGAGRVGRVQAETINDSITTPTAREEANNSQNRPLQNLWQQLDCKRRPPKRSTNAVAQHHKLRLSRRDSR